jgi:chromosome segregation ATPase
MVAEGKPAAALTVTQLRMRVGGGSWSTLRDELEHAQREARGETGDEPREPRLADEVPPELAAQAASVERLLEQAGVELRSLLAAVRAHERQRSETEIASLRAQVDELERRLAASATPASSKTKRRRSGGGAS